MIGAQSDSIGRGAGCSESEKESGTLESWAARRVRLVFGSIAVETVAPEAVSSHPSLIGAVGSELRVGADVGAASGGVSYEDCMNKDFLHSRGHSGSGTCISYSYG